MQADVLTLGTRWHLHTVAFQLHRVSLPRTSNTHFPWKVLVELEAASSNGAVISLKTISCDIVVSV